ncbi:hypothetical protein NKY68_00205 [Sinorhizobium meliloti]|uniref:hypothetical protein n=1 Tax=Rhizobium meliloti TaxID=382 RepID=UPI003D65BA4B
MTVEWLNQWLGEHEHVVSLASNIVGLLGLLIALGSLVYTVSSNTKTQNFNSVLALQNLVRDEKENFHAVASIKPRDQQKYELAAIHFFNTMELVAFCLNRKFLHGRSLIYLAEWMRDELDHIYKSPTQGAVMAALRTNENPPFGEIFRFYPPTKPFPPSPQE